MNKFLLSLLSVLGMLALATPGLMAADYGTRVTVTSSNPEGGVVCVKNATTKYYSIFGYKHTLPADPAESEYADTKTVQWISPGGGSKCEVQFKLYAKAKPGYRFERWENSSGSVANTEQHIETLNHFTKEPDYLPYTYTAVFVAENAVFTELNYPVGKIVLSPEAPRIGDVVTATVETNKIPVSGTPGNPNMMVEFDHWEDELGTVLSHDATFDFTVVRVMTLKAVYRNLGEKPAKGKYYRIRNIFNRVLSLEGAYRISISGAVDIDPSLMRWVMPIDNDPDIFHTGGSPFEISDSYMPLEVETAPGTIFYLCEGSDTDNSLTSVLVDAQGACSKDFIAQKLAIDPMDDALFGYYGMRSNTVGGAGFKTLTRDNLGAILNISSFSTADPWAALAFQPIDEEHIDRYWFGATPDEALYYDGGYWTSMFTSFPYECRDGVEAYYVKETQSANGLVYVCLTRIESGRVPAGEAVLLKCNALTSKGNRLLPLAPDATVESLNGNILKGTYQLYTSKNRDGRVKFDQSTMRILGVSSKGEVGFYKLAPEADGTPAELLANKVYLDMSSLPEASRAASLRIIIGNNGSAGLESIEQPDGFKFENQKIYDLRGIEVDNPQPGQIYIVGGRKVRW